MVAYNRGRCFFEFLKKVRNFLSTRRKKLLRALSSCNSNSRNNCIPVKRAESATVNRATHIYIAYIYIYVLGGKTKSFQFARLGNEKDVSISRECHEPSDESWQMSV